MSFRNPCSHLQHPSTIFHFSDAFWAKEHNLAQMRTFAAWSQSRALHGLKTRGLHLVGIFLATILVPLCANDITNYFNKWHIYIYIWNQHIVWISSIFVFFSDAAIQQTCCISVLAQQLYQFPIVSGSSIFRRSSGSPESLEKGGLAGHCAAGGVSYGFLLPSAVISGGQELD